MKPEEGLAVGAGTRHDVQQDLAQRDRAAGVTYRPGTAARDGMVIAAGAGVWALFAGFLHLWLIGVRPY